MTGLILQLEYSARILLAAVCGACIGYERTNRLKNRGHQDSCDRIIGRRADDDYLQVWIQ